MEEMIGRHQKTPGSIIRAVQERFAPNPDPDRAGKNSGKVPRSWRKELEAESRNFRIENFLDRFLFDVENSVEEIGIPECFRFDAGNDPSHRELAISGNLVPEEDSSDLDGKSISEADDKNGRLYDKAGKVRKIKHDKSDVSKPNFGFIKFNPGNRPPSLV